MRRAPFIHPAFAFALWAIVAAFASMARAGAGGIAAPGGTAGAGATVGAGAAAGAGGTAPLATDDGMLPVVIDPGIAAMVANVSAGRLRATDERLVAFGTRDSFSETLHDKHRGVYAARDWIAAQFREIGKTSGGRLAVALDTFEQPKLENTPRAVEISSVYATLRGDDPTAQTFVISSHYDSRPSDGNDPVDDAPGADDNGSAVAAVLEAARLMAPQHFRGTLLFACFDGEEQGLFGSEHLANELKTRSVGADLNNDIIGASVGHDGEQSPYDVRLFSESLPPDAVPRRVNLLGTENDSPSRELARFTKETAEAYVPAMHANLVYRADRFLRGGDQESFAAAGIPAVRFVEAHENFDHQHQNVRVASGIQYGDLERYVDFDYLARVTQLNVAALATLARAPAAPKATMLVKSLGYDTTLAWNADPAAASYDVVWRTTTEPTWTHERQVGPVTSATLPLSKDDWIFGVRAVDRAGHASVAAYPAPVR